jgi:hypothetical protein
MTLHQTLGSLSVINVQATNSFGSSWSSSRTASLYNQRINKLVDHIVDDYGILPGCCEIFLFVEVSRQCLRHLSLANCFSWNSCVKRSIVRCILLLTVGVFNNAEQKGVPSTKRCIVYAPVIWNLTGKTSRGDTTIWTWMSSVAAANLPASHSRRLGLNTQSSEIILVIFFRSA